MSRYTITITKEITDGNLIKILHSATRVGYYWFTDIKYNIKSYNDAKNKLIEICKNNYNVSYEDVLLKMLKNGNVITFYDSERDKEYNLSLDVLIKGIEYYMSFDDYSSMDMDEWDDTDYDSVIQYAFFGKIVFE